MFIIQFHRQKNEYFAGFVQGTAFNLNFPVIFNAWRYIKQPEW